ncbi:type VI secretion system tip protein VgrG [Dyadobacter sp. NIV53]|uniref:type VI secretion system tip protein VgrG n=1 Tax=Dyadobacter sp. NIV53 TaxID=2861765 RepID=UPI001C876107|nr:type VI secretion system tip protein VgrG [Dyadobacter sp. NIV53]
MSEVVIPQSDLVSLVMKIDGTEIAEQYQLLSVETSKEINKIPTARLSVQQGDVLASGKFPTDDPDLFQPGKEVELQMGFHHETVTIFKGIITRCENATTGSDTVSQLVIECKDQAFRMTAPPKNRHFRNVTDSDITETLAQENEITETEIESSAITHEEITQNNQSDWDFAVSRLDSTGMFCCVSDNVFITKSLPRSLSDGDVVETFAYGENIFELQADTDARTQPQSVRVRTWNPATQSVQETTANDPAEAGQGGNVDAGTLSAAAGSQTLDITHSGSMTQEEQQAIADARLLKSRLSRIRGHFKTYGNTSVKVGDIIKMQRIGSRFDGNHLVSSIKQTHENGCWETEIHFGLASEQFFSETVNPHQPQATATGAMPSVQGLQIGVVTQIDGDPEHRVKVRFPLVNDSDDGIWARISTLDAGNGRGTFFRPEKDDEVILAFINNDIRNPVILGMLHSSALAPPVTPATANNEKGYVSRDGGIKMIFDDDATAFKVETKAGKKLTISDKDKKVLIEDETGNKITFETSGVTIESASNLTVKAGATLSLEGVSVALKGSAMVEINGALVKIN